MVGELPILVSLSLYSQIQNALLTIAELFVGDSKVEIVLGRYKPSVICSTPLPTWRSCGAVMFGMEASPEEKVFGDPSSPHTQVALPAVVDSGKAAFPTVLLSMLPREAK